jgi:YidC/Oxa1 family membrane protein insertase
MDDQNKNLLLATVLSFVVILVWFVLFPPPEPTAPPAPPAAGEATAPAPPATPVAGAEPSATPSGAGDGAAALAETPRVAVDTPRLAGSVSLRGGRLDDLLLKDYKVTLDGGAPDVTLLSAPGTADAQYAYFGWSSPDGTGDPAALPGPDTLWTQLGEGALGVGAPVTLEWTSPAGLAFRRTIAVDEDYLFTVTDAVENTGAAAASLYAYGVVERDGLPTGLKRFFILHEGVVQMTDGTLGEITYEELTETTPVIAEGGPAEVTQVAEAGWIGFTDHYWQTVLVPPAGQPFTAVAKYLAEGDIYRTSYRLAPVELAPGATTEVSTRLFAGAKEWEAIRHYQNDLGIPKFLDSIDWGWFFFLTKPIFAVLHWLNAQIGNMGLAIIALTFIIKAILFPLARKSYVSMARMRELQPELEKLKERAGDDRVKLQKEMMELYKREKVNPAAGCLPILLQIPIFFSLYKVIFVTLELRHAPFVGWIQDLSAPDPSSLFNLFGLLPWVAPEPNSFLALIFIGVLPILLGISMWLQQKLNPAPPDPTQAAIFAWMPWIFMFMLGSFASGLIVYWITNNLLTFAQQYIIMWRHGHRPDLFGNIRKGFGRRRAVEAAAEPKKPGKK